MRLVTSRGWINGQVVISIKIVVQVVILNSAVRNLNLESVNRSRSSTY